MELGIFTFGDIHPDPVHGTTVSPAQNTRDILERARLADQVGLHYFGIGEHHRPDYSVSSPATMLAAVAAQTQRIKVGSAVTVLSTEDPVRVFQQFATIDLERHAALYRKTAAEHGFGDTGLKIGVSTPGLVLRDGASGGQGRQGRSDSGRANAGRAKEIFQLDFSSVPQKLVLESIELLGSEVLPLVRQELG